MALSSADAVLVEVANAVDVLDRRGDLALPRDVEAATAQVLDASPQLLCDAGCPCACHTCDHECLAQSSMIESLRLGLESRHGASGVTWGFLSVDPPEVFVVQRGKFFRLCDLVTILAQRTSKGDVRDYMAPVDVERLRTAIPVDCTLPTEIDRAFGVEYEAVFHNGEPHVHRLVAVVPAASEGTGGGVARLYFLAVDHTDPQRRSFVFNASGTRGTRMRMKEMVAEVRRGGYLTFLVYLALRANSAVNATFAVILRRRVAAPPGVDFVRLQSAAADHLRSATRITRSEEFWRLMTSSRKAQMKRSTPSTDRRLATIDQSLEELRNHEHGGALLVYTGTTDMQVHHKRARDAAEARAVAQSFVGVTTHDAVFACVEHVNASKRAKHSFEDDLRQEEERIVREEAKRMHEQGQTEAACALLLSSSAAVGPFRVDRV
jgi:hypothetical protein